VVVVGAVPVVVVGAVPVVVVGAVPVVVVDAVPVVDVGAVPAVVVDAVPAVVVDAVQVVDVGAVPAVVVGAVPAVVVDAAQVGARAQGAARDPAQGVATVTARDPGAARVIRVTGATRASPSRKQLDPVKVATLAVTGIGHRAAAGTEHPIGTVPMARFLHSPHNRLLPGPDGLAAHQNQAVKIHVPDWQRQD